MKPEAQRIAIAKICPQAVFIVVYRKSGAGQVMDNVTRDPLNDLNAMHEAEKVLNLTQFDVYIHYLSAILCVTGDTEDFCMVHATAAQRAEAFLKTLNLWKDTP